MKLPTSVLVCATVMFTVLITAVVVLSLAQADFTEFRATLNTLLNIVGAASGLSGLMYAGSASRASRDVQEKMTQITDLMPDPPGTSTDAPRRTSPSGGGSTTT
jgi:hypothetical protein